MNIILVLNVVIHHLCYFHFFLDHLISVKAKFSIIFIEFFCFYCDLFSFFKTVLVLCYIISGLCVIFLRKNNMVIVFFLSFFRNVHKPPQKPVFQNVPERSRERTEKVNKSLTIQFLNNFILHVRKPWIHSIL